MHLILYTEFSGKHRRFNKTWFTEKDAGFCLYYYLFPEVGVDLAFITRIFTYWKDPKRLDNHQSLHDSYHNVAKQKCIALKIKR